MRKFPSRFNLSQIMRGAWKAARQASALQEKSVKVLFPQALRDAWANAKSELLKTKKHMAALRPEDIVGYSVDYEGKILTCTGLRKWSSKDGYDKRIYIECDVDGKEKNGLMYFLLSGQVDFFHIPADSPYGTIFVHENVQYELLS